MVPFAPVGSKAFPDPLPSLSAALMQSRILTSDEFSLGRDSTTLDGSRQTRKTVGTNSTSEFTTTITECDWEDILACATVMEDYVSPDVMQYLATGENALQGSQELDLTGREFLSSPSIPFIGPVPRLFTEVVAPNRMAAPAHPRSDAAFTNRYKLRGNPTELPKQPPLEASVTRDTRAAASVLRRMNTNAIRGKSARTRLFASPDHHDKENRSANLNTVNVPLNPKANGKAKLVPTKSPAIRDRLSLDSATQTVHSSDRVQRPSSLRKFKDCEVLGCTRGARSKGLCKRHGGGKRCSILGCARSDQGGGFCISHGGGKRCAVRGCKNSAQSRGLCKSHGGGKRCIAEDCNKSTQDGNFCRKHGGGRPRNEPMCYSQHKP